MRSPEARGANRYDVFLAHGSGDKDLVRKVYETLVQEGYSVFLDSEELIIGQLWRPALEEALWRSRSIAVCVGSKGPGPWTEFEINFALRKNREDLQFPVIPVLLENSGRREVEELSSFLLDFQYVDLTGDELDLQKLLIAIKQYPRIRERFLRSDRLPIGDIQEALKRLQDRFASSLRPYLAGGRKIERPETQQVRAYLEDDTTRIVVIHGVAGSGKSGVLLQLADELSHLGRYYLPLRLDRIHLQGTPRHFGIQELFLPGSPGECLARVGNEDSGAILLLDQLDALRWTGAHSTEAWDVCRETILDALAASPSTKIVVCCRSFDLDHDPQLRTWREGTRNLRPLPVGDLSIEQVQSAIARLVTAEGVARPLDESELQLLRRIHHLQMWMTLYPKLGAQGSLRTRRALMEAFWQDRRTRLSELGISPDRVETIEQRLIDKMDEGARLSVPSALLSLSSKEVQAFQSLHILQMDSERDHVSFCHQSYLDYLVSIRIAEEISCGSKDLLTWLGTREGQSLFRREQLRLILEGLRDWNRVRFLTELQAVLSADQEVRFHLRLLCLQFLSQLTAPSAAEKALVIELLNDTSWKEHVIEEVIRGKPVWFEALDDAGTMQAWLASSDNALQEFALRTILSVVETSGDRVARLLRPYLGAGEEWVSRLLWVLRFDPATDTDALFDLRLDLAKRGHFRAQLVDWSELAKSKPRRFLRLTCQLLLTVADDVSRSGHRHFRSRNLDWHDFDKVDSKHLPEAFHGSTWKELFETVIQLAKLSSQHYDELHVLETYAVPIEAVEPVITLLSDLGQSLLQKDWRAFTTLGVSLSHDRRGEAIFLDSLRRGPIDSDYADWALTWLMGDPWRVRLQVRRSSSKWRLSGQVVRRYASIASEEVYRSFEEWLVGYREPDFKSQYRHRHKRITETGRLEDPSNFGRTQHALFPLLVHERSSTDLLRRVAELNRKFGAGKVLELEEPSSQGGFVGSPIGYEVLAAMTDRSILKLVSSHKLRDDTRGHRWTWKADHIEEASPETISSDFRVATERQPERFGRLLARWPSGGHPAFLEAIFSGLASPKPQGPSSTSDWEPPSHRLLEHLLSLPIVQSLIQNATDTQVAIHLCGLLDRYSHYAWTDNAIEIVAWIAQYHPHPGPDEYPVWSDASSFNRLESNALNVTRGRAGYAIRSLLFRHPSSFRRLQPAIESLVTDPHPAVKVAAQEVCLPIINIDKDKAVELFLTACNGPDQLLATRAADNFFRYSFRTHLSQLLMVIDRMVGSSLSEVATAGARWVTAARLVAGELEMRFEDCISGDRNLRKGVAEVASPLIGEGDYAEEAKATLLRMADDPDRDVGRIVSRSFRKLNLERLQADREAWSRFARSKAFQSDPTPLLQALEKQSGNLLPFADCLIAAGTTFAEELIETAHSGAHGLGRDAALFLLPLLLRLYEQAKDQDHVIYLRCLDLWDRLLEHRIGSAMGLTRELDRV